MSWNINSSSVSKTRAERSGKRRPNNSLKKEDTFSSVGHCGQFLWEAKILWINALFMMLSWDVITWLYIETKIAKTIKLLCSIPDFLCLNKPSQQVDNMWQNHRSTISISHTSHTWRGYTPWGGTADRLLSTIVYVHYILYSCIEQFRFLYEHIPHLSLICFQQTIVILLKIILKLLYKRYCKKKFDACNDTSPACNITLR